MPDNGRKFLRLLKRRQKGAAAGAPLAGLRFAVLALGDQNYAQFCNGGKSVAALLAKLGIKPFEYGLNIKYVYENGIFPVSVLDITEATLMGLWGQACGNVAALSLGAGYPTDCSLPHSIAEGVKNVLAVSLETDYIEYELVEKIKKLLDSA